MRLLSAIPTEFGIPLSPTIFTYSPLCIGSKYDDDGNILEFAAASESCALECVNIDRERDVGAGEIIFIDTEMKIHSRVDSVVKELRPCVFEYVYLARPDSVIDNISVYEARVQMGVRLAERLCALRVITHSDSQQVEVIEPGSEQYKEDLPKLEDLIDVVMAVPDTSRHTAISIATSLGKRYIEGLSKNRYVARTFIMPAQGMRQKSIRIKHNPIHVGNERAVNGDESEECDL